MVTSRRIPGLDEVRGIAILLVVIRHYYDEAFVLAHWPRIGPLVTKIALLGNYGVELFFVLSGFLITKILLETRTSRRYFSTFYARRALRIFPVYFGALAMVFILLPRFVEFDEAGKSIYAQQIWQWTFLSNYPRPDGVNWDSSSLFRLGHFWSLCVEEHYYLVWPAVVYFVNEKKLTRICAGMVIGGVLARTADAIFHLDGTGWQILQWSTIAKLDGLAIGSWLAICWQANSAAKSVITQKTLTIVLLGGGLLFSLALIPRAWHPKGIAVIMELAAVGFSLGLIAATLEGKLRVLTKNTVLRITGKYSYAIYVIHNIILPTLLKHAPLRLFEEFSPTPLVGILLFIFFAICVNFVLAALSWHLFEKRFLNFKSGFRYD